MFVIATLAATAELADLATITKTMNKEKQVKQ
jgi:hypothetical protein